MTALHVNIAFQLDERTCLVPNQLAHCKAHSGVPMMGSIEGCVQTIAE